MSQLKKSFALFAFLFILSGCGLKGDLYWPEAQPQVVDSTPLEESTVDSPAESSELTINNPGENIETTEEVVQPE